MCTLPASKVCFHGEEYVLSLFISDLSGIGAMKVCIILVLLFNHFSNTLTVLF